MFNMLYTFAVILASLSSPLHANEIEISFDSSRLPANNRCLIKIDGRQLFFGACNYDGGILNDRRLISVCPKANCSGASTYTVQDGNFFYIDLPDSVPEGSGSKPIAWNSGVHIKAHATLTGFIREGNCWVNHRTDSTICIDKL
jgi:hypothetical protein